MNGHRRLTRRLSLASGRGARHPPSWESVGALCTVSSGPRATSSGSWTPRADAKDEGQHFQGGNQGTEDLDFAALPVCLQYARAFFNDPGHCPPGPGRPA